MCIFFRLFNCSRLKKRRKPEFFFARLFLFGKDNHPPRPAMLGQGIRGDIGGRAVSSSGHTMMSVRKIRGSGSLASRDALGRAVSSPQSSTEIMSTHCSSEPSEVSTPLPRSKSRFLHTHLAYPSNPMKQHHPFFLTANWV